MNTFTCFPIISFLVAFPLCATDQEINLGTHEHLTKSNSSAYQQGSEGLNSSMSPAPNEVNRDARPNDNPFSSKHLFWGKKFGHLLNDFPSIVKRPLHDRNMDSGDEAEDQTFVFTPKHPKPESGITAKQLRTLKLKTGRNILKTTEHDKRENQRTLLRQEMAQRKQKTSEIGQHLNTFLSPDVAAVLPNNRYSCAPYAVLNQIGFHPAHSAHEKAYRYIALSSALANAYVVREEEIEKWVHNVWNGLIKAKTQGHINPHKRRKISHTVRQINRQERVNLDSEAVIAQYTLKRKARSPVEFDFESERAFMNFAKTAYDKPIPSMGEQDIDYWMNAINNAQRSDQADDSPNTAQGIIDAIKVTYHALFYEEQQWQAYKQDHIRFFNEQAADSLLQAQKQSEEVATNTLMQNKALGDLIQENPELKHAFESAFSQHPAFGLLTSTIPLSAFTHAVESDQRSESRVTQRPLSDFTQNHELQKELNKNPVLEQQVHEFVRQNFDFRRLIQSGSELDLHPIFFLQNFFEEHLKTRLFSHQQNKTNIINLLIAFKGNWYDSPMNFFTGERFPVEGEEPYPALEPWMQEAIQTLPNVDLAMMGTKREMHMETDKLINHFMNKITYAMEENNSSLSQQIKEFRAKHPDLIDNISRDPKLAKFMSIALTSAIGNAFQYHDDEYAFPTNILPLLIQHRLYLAKENTKIKSMNVSSSHPDKVQSLEILDDWFASSENVRPMTDLIWQLTQYDVLKRQLSAPWKELISQPIERAKFVTVLQKIARTYVSKDLNQSISPKDSQPLQGHNPVIDFLTNIPDLEQALLPQLDESEKNDERYTPYGSYNLALQQNDQLTLEALLRSPVIIPSINDDATPSSFNNYYDAAYYLYAAGMRDNQHERKLQSFDKALSILKTESQAAIDAMPLMQKQRFEQKKEDLLFKIQIQWSIAMLSHNGFTITPPTEQNTERLISTIKN